MVLETNRNVWGLMGWTWDIWDGLGTDGMVLGTDGMVLGADGMVWGQMRWSEDRRDGLGDRMGWSRDR